MDLLCQRCGEPWDVLGMTDEFTPRERVAFNRGQGCPSCEGKAPERFAARAESTSFAREVQTEMRYLLGDDVDGLAAMMDDFGLA